MRSFNEFDTTIKADEHKFYEVNSKTDILYMEAKQKFDNIEAEMKKHGTGNQAGTGNNNNSKKT